MLLFVRGFGDLLLLSSVALAPSLVRSLVQLWRLSWRVASSRGGGRVLLLVPSGCRFVSQVFGHPAHVRLPFACATMHSAVSWTRAGPGVSVSLLRLCSSCSPSDRGSFVIGQVTVPAFLRVAAGFSDGLFAHAVCPSRCQLCGISWAAGWWTATQFPTFFRPI